MARFSRRKHLTIELTDTDDPAVEGDDSLATQTLPLGGTTSSPGWQLPFCHSMAMMYV
ncbi:MAG: hypothetical protein H0T14_00310 [Nocardioidaceae bacterium]|nr:hypothetical protein [Nocardioidaceae bacterium]